jgi:hypothetical protein
MGIFSKGPSTKDQITICLNYLCVAFSNQSKETQAELQQVFLSGINTSLHRSPELTPIDAMNAMNFVRIMTNGVGVNAELEILDFSHRPTEAASTIYRTLPFNMPLMVIGAVRMGMEEYLAGKSFDQIDFQVFADGPERRLVNILVEAIEAMNIKCIQDPKKHPAEEVIQMSVLVGSILQVGYKRVSAT